MEEISVSKDEEIAALKEEIEKVKDISNSKDEEITTLSEKYNRQKDECFQTSKDYDKKTTELKAFCCARLQDMQQRCDKLQEASLAKDGEISTLHDQMAELKDDCCVTLQHTQLQIEEQETDSNNFMAQLKAKDKKIAGLRNEMDKVKQKLTESRQLVLKERGYSEQRLLELDTVICWRGQRLKVLEAEVEARGRRICELEPKADASSGVDLPGPEQVLAADASSGDDSPGPEQAADASSGVDSPGPEQNLAADASSGVMRTRERNFCFVYIGDRMHYPDFNELNFIKVEGCSDTDGNRLIQYVQIQLHANNTRLKDSIPKIIEQYNRMEGRTQKITPEVFFPPFQTSPIVCFNAANDDNPILKRIAQQRRIAHSNESSYWRWVSPSSKRGPPSFFPSEPQLP